MTIKSTLAPSRRSPGNQRGQSLKSMGTTDVMLRIEDNFDRWDRDNSGHITWSEMRKNVADPDITGRDAAALATLYSLNGQMMSERELVRRPSIHKHDVANMRSDYLHSEEAPLADHFYNKYLGKLENASEELFTDAIPNGFHGAQGSAPSCGFLAATFAQARKDPRVIQEAITEREDGKVEVKFPGLKKPVVINPTTDTETALFATSSENGTWLNTLEKAWGTHQTKTPNAAFEQSTWPEEAIQAWTNGKVKTTRIPKTLKNYKMGETPHFLKSTQKELASNHLIITWTKFEGLSKDGLVPGHAYTLSGFDQDNGTVELRNPWGNFEPQEDGEALDGRNDGIFELTIPEFQKNFGHIARQTD